jgi:CUE domain
MSSNNGISTTMAQLATDLESLSISPNGKTSSNVNQHDMSRLVPSLRQFFQMGLLLCQIQQEHCNLMDSYQLLIDSIPDTLLGNSFYQLQQATATLLDKKKHINDWTPTCQSLCGLFTHSSRLCQVVYSSDWVATLASLYDRLVISKQPEDVKNMILSSLSSLLLEGLFDGHSTSTHASKAPLSLEEALLAAIRAIENESTDCLGDLLVWQRKQSSAVTLAVALQQQLESIDEERRDYIFSMLESALLQSQQPSDPTFAPSTSTSNRNTTKAVPKTTAADELDRRIDQVKQILPHLGEGFIEAALSLHQADVERTVATLLNDPSQYPSALQILDSTLPRRKKDNVQDDQASAEEARQLVKERVALEEQKEAARYQALLYVTQQQQQDQQEQEVRSHVHHQYQNEYNDDYDDQYDEVDIRLGSIDDGFTMDNDFEQVKLYNQLVRDDEAEDSFWKDNRNTNRQQQQQGKSRSKSPKDTDGDKQFRGPNKIKGGRVLGPDGKIVKKSGGARKGGGNPKKGGPSATPPQPSPGNQGSGSTSNNSTAPKGKPRTKPKSDNRVSRQRDRKQHKQGTFGVSE